MDLEKHEEFRTSGIQLVSIAPDPPRVWRQQTRDHDIDSPLLSDTGNAVADRYGVMRWRVPASADVDSAEPGHTFVLVDEERTIRWIRDYGAAEHGGIMYVAPDALLEDMRADGAWD